jgi:hypothetical protein
MRTFTLTLLALTAGFACGETDPEPPAGAATLRKLKGTWNSVRAIIREEERQYTPVSYTFAGDRATYAYQRIEFTDKLIVKIDLKRPNVLTMTPEGSTRTRTYFFKIEKGELFLVPDNSNDPKSKRTSAGVSVR